MIETIYLDSCVLNRPTDDLSQQRILLEALAIARILDRIADGTLTWTSSTVVELELRRNPNSRRRNDALRLLQFAVKTIRPTSATLLRSDFLTKQGYSAFDALHLALAEEAQASTLLTVDDRFLKKAGTRPGSSLPVVDNPVNWLRTREPWLIKR